MQIRFAMLRKTLPVAIGLLGLGCAPSSPPATAHAPVWNVPLNTTIDLEAYRASLPSPGLSGHTRSRLGRNCGNCWTNVSIEAYTWAKNYGAANFPANPGDMYPIGHIVNTGTLETDMYSLKPSTIAEYDIYVTNDGGEAGWKIIEVPQTLTGELKVIKKGKLFGCPGHPGKPRSEADFRNCDYGASTQTPLRLANATGWENLIGRMTTKLSSAPQSLEDPGWISCTEGCCTMTGEY